IVAGTSVESYHSWSCWVERSIDNGHTWSRHGPIILPGFEYGIIQPTIVPISGHRLRMFVRATEQIGRVCYADSSDDGISWTSAQLTYLPNPNSGIDAVKLSDGRGYFWFTIMLKGGGRRSMWLSLRMMGTPGNSS